MNKTVHIEYKDSKGDYPVVSFNVTEYGLDTYNEEVREVIIRNFLIDNTEIKESDILFSYTTECEI